MFDEITYILNTPYHHDECYTHLKSMFNTKGFEECKIQDNTVITSLNSIKKGKEHQKALIYLKTCVRIFLKKRLKAY